VATNARFVGAVGQPSLQISFLGMAHYLLGRLDVELPLQIVFLKIREFRQKLAKLFSI